MVSYELIVGNIGSVRKYDAMKLQALKDYHEYVVLSKSGSGRVAGEQVVLFRNDEIIREYHPRLGELRIDE